VLGGKAELAGTEQDIDTSKGRTGTERGTSPGAMAAVTGGEGGRERRRGCGGETLTLPCAPAIEGDGSRGNEHWEAREAGVYFDAVFS
jgi:hypothetical protein